jgi:hypothetical protein
VRKKKKEERSSVPIENESTIQEMEKKVSPPNHFTFFSQNRPAKEGSKEKLSTKYSHPVFNPWHVQSST